MQDDRNAGPVDWSMWSRNRGGDVRRPDKMFSVVDRDGITVCVLCSGRVPAWKRTAHHLAHMVDLDAWLATGGAGPPPRNVSRSENRRARRRAALEQAAEIGEDPYHVAVLGRNPKTQHWVRRRRLRHPREETKDRVRTLLFAGRSPGAIEVELGKSRNYVRRLIREIEG